jgi:hypothetical protein
MELAIKWKKKKMYIKKKVKSLSLKILLWGCFTGIIFSVPSHATQDQELPVALKHTGDTLSFVRRYFAKRTNERIFKFIKTAARRQHLDMNGITLKSKKDTLLDWICKNIQNTPLYDKYRESCKCQDSHDTQRNGKTQQAQPAPSAAPSLPTHAASVPSTAVALHRHTAESHSVDKPAPANSNQSAATAIAPKPVPANLPLSSSTTSTASNSTPMKELRPRFFAQSTPVRVSKIPDFRKPLRWCLPPSNSPTPATPDSTPKEESHPHFSAQSAATTIAPKPVPAKIPKTPDFRKPLRWCLPPSNSTTPAAADSAPSEDSD